MSNNVFYATGKQIKPTVNLYVDGQLVPAYHYKITYSSNINTGVAKVKLTATEVKYVSVCSTTFLILPVNYKRSKNEFQKQSEEPYRK